MADFDLSQLGKQQPNSDGGNSGVHPIRQQNITTERIDTTAGKVQPRKGNYVSPAEASRMNTSKRETTDPIFDTPPTFKVKGSDSNIQSLDDGISMGANRTPVNAGKPTQTPKVHSVKSDTDIPDPTPLKVVNNFAHKFNDGGELTPFDPSSLPKKKPEMGHDEEEDMALLEKAVEREKKSISERVQALTNKQYEEYLEARAEGKQITRPMTDEEVAAEEEARINGTNDDTSDDGEEIQIQKRIHCHCW